MKALASQISSTLNFGSRSPEGTVATTPSFDLLDPYVRCDKRLSRGEEHLSRGEAGEDSAAPTEDSCDVDPRRGGDRSPNNCTFSPAMGVLAGVVLDGNGGGGDYACADDAETDGAVSDDEYYEPMEVASLTNGEQR